MENKVVIACPKGNVIYVENYWQKRSNKAFKELCKESISKNVDVFHIGLYAGDYWLHIEIPKDYTFRDLDQFIRDIWVECCDHLSEFTIGKTRYISNFDEEDANNSFFNAVENEINELADITEDELNELDNIISSVKSDRLREILNDLKIEIKLAKLLKEKFDIPKEQSMDIKLGDVLKVGDKFLYVYDFGTPTEIDLKVIDERKGMGFRILARNLPIEFKCSVCGKKAKWVCPYCLFEGEDCYFCDECAKEHECYEDGLLPIVNSPRCGVCGYEGSLKYGDI